MGLSYLVLEERVVKGYNWPIQNSIFNVWQKPLQYCKVISLQLIKIHGKNK